MCSSGAAAANNNPTVYFDIAADNEPLGRVTFEVSTLKSSDFLCLFVKFKWKSIIFHQSELCPGSSVWGRRHAQSTWMITWQQMDSNLEPDPRLFQSLVRFLNDQSITAPLTGLCAAEYARIESN